LLSFEVLSSPGWISKTRTNAIQEEIIAKMDAHQERMRASVNAWWKKMMACLGKTVATNLLASPEEIEFKAENEEVPKEEAAMKTFRALKERYE
jgi:hypothetical protein